MKVSIRLSDTQIKCGKKYPPKMNLNFKINEKKKIYKSEE